MTLPEQTRRRVLMGAAATAALPFSPALMAATPKIREVAIKSFKFDPEILQVRVGDTIRWTNKDLAPHTATADEFGWDTGSLERDEAAEVEVTADMETSYFCVFHPHMKGSLEIIT